MGRGGKRCLRSYGAADSLEWRFVSRRKALVAKSRMDVGASAHFTAVLRCATTSKGAFLSPISPHLI